MQSVRFARCSIRLRAHRAFALWRGKFRKDLGQHFDEGGVGLLAKLPAHRLPLHLLMLRDLGFACHTLLAKSIKSELLLSEMKIALMVRQLDLGHILCCSRVVRVERAHRIIGCGVQKVLDLGNRGVIDFAHIRIGVEIRNGFVAEISPEYESIARGEASRCVRWRCRLGHGAGLRTGIASWWLKVRCDVARETGVR
jgi:hypothetical protein